MRLLRALLHLSLAARSLERLLGDLTRERERYRSSRVSQVQRRGRPAGSLVAR